MSLSTILLALLLWLIASLPIGIAIGRWLHRLSDPAPSYRTFLSEEPQCHQPRLPQQPPST